MKHYTELAATFAFVAILLPAVSGLAFASEYTEDFTSAFYEDAANTTAHWDVTSGELGLFPFQPTIQGAYDTPGSARDIFVSGDYAFVADLGSGLQVIDISDPTNPTLLGSYDTPTNAFDVVVSGDYAFVANYNSGLMIFDISDPTNLLLIGECVTPAIAVGVAVAGDHAYVAMYSGGLQIIDISDPTAPTLLGVCDTPGIAQDVTVAGDCAFVADDHSGLQIIDISDPGNPAILGAYDTPSYSFEVAIAGDCAFVADAYSGLQLIDISDPRNPTLLGACDTPSTAYGVTVSGDFAYVADYNSGVQVVDISDLGNPTVVQTCATPGDAFGVAIAGDYAYVAATSSGLQVVEIAKFFVPSLVATYDTPVAALDVAIAGNYAFVAGSDDLLQVIDISDPTDLSFVTNFNLIGGAQFFTVSGNHLFVLSFLSGLQIIDISDPTHPALVGTHNPGALFLALTIAGDYAFLSGKYSGLHVVDIKDPTAPTALSILPTAGYPFGVVTAGDYAYVAAYDHGLQVIDISDPANPVSVGIYDTPHAAYDVAIAGDCAYVADGLTGLLMIDISDPANPALLGGYNTPDVANRVTVSGDYVFVGDNESGLQVIDVSDPATPTLLGNYDTPGDAYEVVTAGDYAYVADYSSGLQVIRVFQREFFLDDNVGRSLVVDESDNTILAARLTTAQADSVTWELSAEGGASWQEFVPDGNWNRLTSPGADLIWRSTHTWLTPGVNPAVASLHLEWLYEFAPIVAVSDVPGDQGGLVDVTISRSAYDIADEVSLPVTGYNIYRRVDGGSLAAKGLEFSPLSGEQALLTSSGAKAWPLPGVDLVTSGANTYAVSSAEVAASTSFPPGTWKLVASAFATQSDRYLIEATTVADSTTAGIDWSVYLVTTHTTTPSVWFASQPDSGYSVDNIAPGVPTALAASYQAGGVTLDWDDAPESDFQYYHVYRGTDPGFVPSPGNLVHETALSAWTDPTAEPWASHYKVTALDHSGNESQAGSPTVTSGVQGDAAPLRAALYGAYPNPFNPQTTIRFDLPNEQPVSLRIFDISGRLVRVLVDDYVYSQGRGEVAWNGQGDNGLQVAAGVYFYRLDAGEFSETKRMALVK